MPNDDPPPTDPHVEPASGELMGLTEVALVADAVDSDQVLVESTGHRTVMAKPSIVDDPSPALWARA
ncbi:MAG TPA: hypothetical protein VFN59_00155, partial [Acidimicrobiales bacterium]|nr:hypothetical protein [Acidimicrobiales bacterium]